VEGRKAYLILMKQPFENGHLEAEEHEETKLIWNLGI
jgi:hypothetical protein